MKGVNLGEFQEIVLLTIMILGEEAYGVPIQKDINARTGRKVSRGALHAALSRLEEKGYIKSAYRGATPERGGRRKRFYRVTTSGASALREAKSLRQEMWQLIPNLD